MAEVAVHSSRLLTICVLFSNCDFAYLRHEEYRELRGLRGSRLYAQVSDSGGWSVTSAGQALAVRRERRRGNW